MEKSSKDSGMDRGQTDVRRETRPDPAYVLAAIAIWAMVAYSIAGPRPSARIANAAQLCSR